ncbi:lantibiotic, gallidermin/nisin family [Pseudobutyrivibrio sp. 49]|uniref:gallidermin/nisin family lantibiotic n=1 Tax=unclassified Pseudobutyrivibrio TaxID=2638619 RepID=UPI00088F1912|nr:MULTISPECIES: gallidermin/nisin family lantibiotic [unclassified Pseudobutyrivibrio]SDI40029.1 lantibiotic, gallidermin/nisin family [Pseudobutyrivibrio sp. 49]SFO06014.1 lantibiotic, gallidermin/nisin family [Pseudobutyrivibrio sp. UC1225]
MEKFNNDFNLDVTVSKDDTKKADVKITSKSLCTPGCVTGVLMGCNNKTATCNCSVHVG